MKQTKQKLTQLLPHGAVTAIAKKLGVSPPAVSQALKIGRPGSYIVQEAMRMAQESGAINTAQALAILNLE